MIAMAGFAAGWSLPDGPEPSDSAAVASNAVETTGREQRKRDLSEQLLDEQERMTLHKSTASLAELLATGHECQFNEEDIVRLVTMNPAGAMDFLLTNPVAPSNYAVMVTEAWARRDPDRAIAYLRTKSSYLADDCLAKALPVIYLSRPKLVAEVLRSKSAQWQERYLNELFGETFRVRKSGAPPEQESDDPFFDDGQWTEVRFGADLLDCLASDYLREKAKARWERNEDDEPTTPGRQTSPPDPHTWNPATYDKNDYHQRSQLFDELRTNSEETVNLIAANGNEAARGLAMSSIMGRFPSDPEKWPEALESLEAPMQQLGVIPSGPPSHFEMGPILYGEAAGQWIDRQPLALRRAWALSFVERWVQVDPRAALAWAEALPKEANRDAAFQIGLQIWTHEDPLTAVARVEDLPQGELREAAISNAAATWDCIDPAAARQWVGGLAESPGKTRALERLKR
ncbi:hypothetical protein OKA04_06275 [Luteolibacter flavescens]|uniref:Uncharacterized protein n=1 Tax=Luteolibacter flavescens TaxID=1859460 RepID=A0ABT3FL92_9BACT|nr:hypothetical protein [Luteolibacter flavescens]MCW1884330.1 hypothetical protein [Luteolibacter flavescens]